MSVDLAPLQSQSRLLFEIPLKPMQGQRFQPAGFPNLGAATFKSSKGDCLLVESVQSMANRLEMTIWDAVKQAPVDAVAGISHVRVERKGSFLTDSMLESHRINSPYVLECSDRTLFNKKAFGAMDEGPIDRQTLGMTLLRYDVGSLLHGVFLPMVDGRLRVARAVSAFIEADGVRVAASGGVKNDAVNPSGDAKKGFGNVPFSRDEFTADRIMLYANIDLAQMRGYALGEDVVKLLTLLALYKLRKLIDGDLRLRTACDLTVVNASAITATNVPGFVLPSAEDLAVALKLAISACKAKMVTTTVQYNDSLKKAKGEDAEDAGEAADETEPGEGA